MAGSGAGPVAALWAGAAAGAAYFALVFAAGFALGALRVLALEPRLGATAAVAAELPVMLAIAWIACGLVLRRTRLASARASRVAMGGVALGLLLVAEALLAAAIGPGAGAWARGLATPAGALGLAGQLAFALMPLLRR